MVIRVMLLVIQETVPYVCGRFQSTADAGGILSKLLVMEDLPKRLGVCGSVALLSTVDAMNVVSDAAQVNDWHLRD